MERVRINRLPATQHEVLKQKVENGIFATESALFDYCVIARNRLGHLLGVTKELEDHLFTGGELLMHIQTLATPEQKLNLYHEINGMVSESVSFLQKMHMIISDQAKYDHLKRLLSGLVKEEPIKVEGEVRKEKIKDVVDIFKDELRRRAKVVLR